MPKKSENPARSPDVKSVESSQAPAEKKKMPPIAIVGIGCLALLLFFGIGMTIAGKVLFSKIGGSLIQKAIEEKSGVKIDTDSEGNVVSLKDTKTGSEVNIGSGQMPKGFPSDFPIYPGAKPAGNVVGSEKTEGTEFWLLMESSDVYASVEQFYDAKLKSSGWTTEDKTNFGSTSASWKLAKGMLEGTLVVSAGEKGENKTTVLITLNPKSSTTIPAE